ncbi:hypothetical protein M1328_02230 [Patescibacteria group bacterium]|nr:hypothetical protein [Patescibacteria group bacterium]
MEKYLKKNLKTAVLLFLFLIIICLVIELLYQWNKPMPFVEFISSSTKIEQEKPIKITMILRNIGGPASTETTAHGGIHVEVKDAIISKIVATTSKKTHGAVEMISGKQDGFTGFESAYLNQEKTGEIQFDIVPNTSQVIIDYRAWLPAKCSIFDRLLTMISMRKRYSDWKNSWRSENCITRNPNKETNDKNKRFCHIKVFAGHKDLQSYLCLEKTLSQ